MNIMNKRIILSIISLLTLAIQVSAEDKVTIKDFSISAGETKDVSITLDNDVTYAAFQFDLYLPEGISVTEYNADKNRVPEGTTLEMNKLEDGSYRFIAAAMDLQEINGTSGSIITIKVTASETLESGNLTGYFRKVKLSKVDGDGNQYSEMSFPITIEAQDLITGDVNNDGTVDISDYIGVANHILGNTPAGFNETAADVNNDGSIDISDYIGVANIILTGKP